MDPAQLVFDNEVARMVRFVVEGIPVNDQTLSVDAIKQTGPFKDYLMHPETLKYARSQSKPELIDRRNRNKWESNGSRDTVYTATEKAKWIIENHEIKVPVSDEAKEKVRAIIRNAEKELGYE